MRCRRQLLLLALAVVLVAGCATSWERHEKLVEENRATGDFRAAAEYQKWLVDHSLDAPPKERRPDRDVERELVYGDLLGRAGQTAQALDVYRDVLRLDPNRLEDVLTGIGMFPIPQNERDRYMDEFVRTGIVLAPTSHMSSPSEGDCWSYSVRELRIRRIWTRTGDNGLERLATYDALAWFFDANHRRWTTDGNWSVNVGAAVQVVTAPVNPNYKAVIDADGGFYADNGVPPCHLSSWHGPYDARRMMYVARQLPGR